MLNDCHVITKKMLEFDYETIVDILKEEIKKTMNFYRNAIKGFYCGICDAKSHEFFNI